MSRLSSIRHIHAIVLFLLISAAVMTACAVNPVTGKRQLMLISTAQEAALGAESDTGIIAAYGLYDDADLAGHIAAMGEQMARDSHRPDLEWTFRVLDSPVINAFAVPGGYVYMTRGILPYLGSEAELAGVLGHEIGHITARHSARRLSQAQLAQIGLGVGSAVSGTFRRYSAFAEAGVGLLMLSFSRDNEREADRLGIEYATTGGWAAGEMANFFATLERMSPKSGGGLPDWLSTHPAPEKRVESVRELAEEWRGKVEHATLLVNQEDYLQLIEGLVYGADPRQGFVRDGWFNHPGLTFRFPLPEGWTVVNEPTRVQLTDPDEEAVILFTIGSSTSPEEEAAAFIEDLGVEPVENKAMTIHGYAARQTRVVAETEQGAITILSTFIRKGDSVYVFHALCARDDFDAWQSTFDRTMSGFTRLTDRALIEVEPERIRVVRIERAGTLRTFLLTSGIPADRLEEFSLLNGRSLDDHLAAGEAVKIVEPGGN